ncbi:MAG: SH3 domain-containing protein [Thermomicrobiales bacterium]
MIALGTAGIWDQWSIRVDEVALADAAAALVAGWNTANTAPPDGLAFVAVRVHAENGATVRRLFGSFRFLVSGGDGVFRGSPDLAVPRPSEGMVDSGQAIDGWMVFLSDGDPYPGLWLWYADALPGPDWRDAAFALHPDSTMPVAQPVDGSAIGAGLTPEAPAVVGEPVLAANWIVSLVEVVEGQAVADLAGEELRRFAQSTPRNIPSWIAARLKIENASDRPALFSPSAVQITDATGDPWAHVLALTPPVPDASVMLVPGMPFEGWIAFQQAAYNDKGIIDAPAERLRVLPSPLVDEARWISVGGKAAATSVPDSEDRDWMEGDLATVSEDRVNLRMEASRTGAILAELAKGTRVRVAGEVVAADGVTWVPVVVEASGQQGFVASSYLTPVT